MYNFTQNLAPRFIRKTVHRNTSNNQCPPADTSGHKDGGYKVYKYLTFLVGFPAICAAGALAYIQKKKRECDERLPFAPYEYLRRRTKRFPWGDGNKSLFHNPAVNALPEGYEVTQDLECADEAGDEDGEGEGNSEE